MEHAFHVLGTLFILWLFTRWSDSEPWMKFFILLLGLLGVIVTLRGFGIVITTT